MNSSVLLYIAITAILLTCSVSVAFLVTSCLSNNHDNHDNDEYIVSNITPSHKPVVENFFDVDSTDVELIRTGFNDYTGIGTQNGIRDFIDYSDRFIGSQFQASNIRLFADCNDCCK